MISKKEFFKLKVAIVLGYNGLEFHGMQKYILFTLILAYFLET